VPGLSLADLLDRSRLAPHHSRLFPQALAYALGDEVSRGRVELDDGRSPRAAIAHDLRSFGEDVLAKRVASVTSSELEQIFNRAGEIVLRGPFFARAVALAAVEVIEGRPRELARKRRRPGFANAEPQATDEEWAEALDHVAEGWPFGAEP
jgi:hypothetical protein